MRTSVPDRLVIGDDDHDVRLRCVRRPGRQEQRKDDGYDFRHSGYLFGVATDVMSETLASVEWRRCRQSAWPIPAGVTLREMTC